MFNDMDIQARIFFAMTLGLSLALFISLMFTLWALDHCPACEARKAARAVRAAERANRTADPIDDHFGQTLSGRHHTDTDTLVMPAVRKQAKR